MHMHERHAVRSDPEAPLMTKCCPPHAFEHIQLSSFIPVPVCDLLQNLHIDDFVLCDSDYIHARQTPADALHPPPHITDALANRARPVPRDRMYPGNEPEPPFYCY